LRAAGGLKNLQQGKILGSINSHILSDILTWAGWWRTLKQKEFKRNSEMEVHFCGVFK
jgi:hypothetical protein